MMAGAYPSLLTRMASAFHTVMGNETSPFADVVMTLPLNEG
jgi:hypothetical protein